MEYRRIEPHWEDAEKTGDISRALDLLEAEIATNLCMVHNAFSDTKIQVRDVFVYYAYNEVNEEHKDAFEPFIDLDFELRSACQGRAKDSGMTPEEVFKNFKVILTRLQEEMMKI
jgi:hypothetical protein